MLSREDCERTTPERPQQTSSFEVYCYLWPRTVMMHHSHYFVQDKKASVRENSISFICGTTPNNDTETRSSRTPTTSPHDGDHNNTPVTSTTNAQEDTIDSGKIRRISIVYKGKTERVCWYGEEPTLQAIEGTLRQTFHLPPHACVNLRNDDGDIVAFTSKLPAHEQFTLEVTSSPYSSTPTKMAIDEDHYNSRSDSSTPGSPDHYISSPNKVRIAI